MRYTSCRIQPTIGQEIKSNWLLRTMDLKACSCGKRVQIGKMLTLTICNASCIHLGFPYLQWEGHHLPSKLCALHIMLSWPQHITDAPVIQEEEKKWSQKETLSDKYKLEWNLPCNGKQNNHVLIQYRVDFIMPFHS